MPRIIDKLDAASGLLPEVLEHDIDYLTKQPAPTHARTPNHLKTSASASEYAGATLKLGGGFWRTRKIGPTAVHTRDRF